jgi:integrase
VAREGRVDQDAVIEAVAEANPNSVVVLETGGPVLTPWRDHTGIRAPLEAWHPGANGGTALARVLFGEGLTGRESGGHSTLNRAVRQAMVRGYVDRNVVEVCRTPRGKEGRPSKAFTLEQTQALLTRTVHDPLHCYIAVSILTGARTEELRALRWEHVHLDGKPHATPPVPPYVEVWRSVRKSGDTKTHKSRRTLALPALAVEKLREHRTAQERQRATAKRWVETGLVFTTEVGTEMDAANVRRGFRRALHLVPGIDPDEWTPREMRHTFVSLLSDSGMPIDEIAKLVGHTGGSSVTERVYRKQLRPVIQTGATAMDMLFESVGRRDGDDDA